MKRIIYPDLAMLLVILIAFSSSSLKAQTYRILPLGNSITQGMGAVYIPESERISYRKELSDLLSAGAYNCDFVGHRNAGYDLFSDGDHGGIPGTRAQYVVRLLQDGYDERWGKQITPDNKPYLDVYPADIILIHIGTNDITHGEGPGTTDLENILDEIDAWESKTGTHVVVFVARIVRRTDNTADNTSTKQLNDNVAAMVSRRGDPSIFLVNLETGAGINYDTELEEDGVHPLQSAYDKMGKKWFESLDAYLGVIPDSPGGFAVSPESSNSIALSWEDNSNNETGFEIERSLTSDGGSFALIHTTGAGATGFTDVGLNENTVYHYRVRAKNSLGPSLYTPIKSSTTLSGALAAPGGLQATAIGESSIGLVWSDNSAGETAFSIERSENTGSGFEAIHSTSANETSYVDSPLPDGTEYFYRVRATNGAAFSSYSNETSAATELAGPTDISASAADETSIHLSWTDNSVSETAYIIERSENSGTGFSPIHTSSANASDYTDSGLPDGRTYFYRIRAMKGEQLSEYSDITNAETLLAAPTGLMAISVDESTIGLEWTDNSQSESGYLIERSEDLGNTYYSIGVVAANIVTYTDEGLVTGSQFVYRVRATNGSIYSAYSNPASVSSNLTAPSGLIANPVDETRIQISWTDESYSEVAYVIERSESSGSGFQEIQAVSANETFYEDDGLADGRTYYYQVRAINGNLSSDYSNEASATTDLASPSGLAVNEVNEASIELIWTDNSASESGYALERSRDSESGFTEVGTSPENTDRYTDTGLADGMAYFYRIRASKGEAHSDFSNLAGATTDLAAPTGLTAIAMQDGFVNLGWVDNSLSETGYSIERSEVSGTGFAEIFVCAANTITFNDEETDGKEQYYYRIRATGGNMFSAYSNEVLSATSVPLSDSLFSFYPNPNHGVLTVVIQRNEEEISEAYLRLVDFSGRVHFTEELDLSDGRPVEIFEIELPPALKDGLYSLSLITDSQTVSEKFILMR